MKINDQWSIEQGNDCFVVVERRKGRNPKTGEATETEVRTYHPTLGQCAKKIMKTETLSAMDEADLWEVRVNIQDLTERLIVAVEDAGKEALAQREEKAA